MITNAIEPLVKELTVPLDQERAFRLFTDGVARWWPLLSHSVERGKAVSCRLEPWVGGRLYEIAQDGTEHTWGTLRAWEPPRRIVLTWHPGREASTAQEVEITFEPAGVGTALRLVHAGWEVLGEDASRVRGRYDRGWDVVLGEYVRDAI